MKIALINPDSGGYPEIYPIAILNLAAHLRKGGNEVIIIDMPVGDSLAILLNYFKPDIVGLSALTSNVSRVYAIADIIKKSVLTVIGGKHASIFPEEALEHCHIVVTGEGEYAFDDIVSGKVKSGIYHNDKLVDVEAIPILPYDLINMEFYTTIPRRVNGDLLAYTLPSDKVATLVNSRGCPYKCTFCYNSKRSLPYRVPTPEKIVKEIEFLTSNYDIKSICLLDDDLLTNKKYIEKLCKLIKESKNKFYWSINARATDVTEPVLDMLYDAGCVQLAFGFESASNRILEILNKKITVEDSKRAIELCNKKGIIIQGSFMIGNPTERSDEMQATIDFINNNNIDGGIGVAMCTPFPNTVIYDWCIENHRMIANPDWKTFNYSTANINMSNVLQDKLNALHKSAIEACVKNVNLRTPSRESKTITMKKRLNLL